MFPQKYNSSKVQCFSAFKPLVSNVNLRLYDEVRDRMQDDRMFSIGIRNAMTDTNYTNRCVAFYIITRKSQRLVEVYVGSMGPGVQGDPVNWE